MISLYLALQSINQGNYSKICIVRSAVPSRNIGFLPGSIQEKNAIYELPYQSLCSELYSRGDAYEILKKKDMIDFFSTSYLRGLTLRDCVLFVDEIQNLSDHEINSIITRVGENCRVILSGDFRQTDLINEKDKSGVNNLIRTIEKMESFDMIDFKIDDICRSGIVKEYIMAREKIGL